jgi:hypothetical protein
VDAQRIEGLKCYHRGTMGRLRWDTLAILVITLVAMLLFHTHLSGRGTFIGEQDRLNTFLNMRTFEVDAIQRSEGLGWNPTMFMGFSPLGLHWMLPGASPLAYFESLFPRPELYRVAGFVSCFLLSLCAFCAYLFIRDSCADPVFAILGGLLYALSSYAALRICEVDPSFNVLILTPLAALVVRRTRRDNACICLLALAPLLMVMLAGLYLQEVGYIIAFLGLFALYRARRTRSPFPVLVLAFAILSAAIVSSPRIVTVAEDFREIVRSRFFLTTWWGEVMRLFDEGIFGRYPSELFGLHNSLNLREGFQLYTTTFTPLIILLGSAVFRRWGALAASLLLVVLASIPEPLIFRKGCLLLALLALLFQRAVLAAVPLDRPAQLTWQGRVDAPFHLFFLALTVAVVFRDDVKYVLHILCFKTDFTHSRLCVAALLPVSTLTASILSRWRGEGPRSMQELGLSLAIAYPLLVAVDRLTRSSVVLGFLPSRPTLGPWVGMVPGECVRVFLWVVVFAFVSLQLFYFRNSIVMRRLLTTLMAWLMLGQAVQFQLLLIGGPHTWSYPVPFNRADCFTAPVEALRPPNAAELAAIHQRLETENYRSVMVGSSAEFPTYCAPHLSQFWRLRVVEGYIAGVPRRLSFLPWPQGVQSLRALSFHSFEELSWPLLALLNVKYAVKVSPSFYYNVNCDPKELEVFENPLPVVPRHFFAESVEPVRGDSLTGKRFMGLRGLAVTCTNPKELVVQWEPRFIPGAIVTVELQGPKDRTFRTVASVKDASRAPIPGLEPATTYRVRLRLDEGGEVSSPPPLEATTVPAPVPTAGAVALRGIAGAQMRMAAEVREFMPQDPRKVSRVEGIPATVHYPTGGRLDVSYAQDRIRVDMDPSPQARFLVLNELYHPRWCAFANGQALKIYPTNQVMRGLVVPGGVSHIDLVFLPFIRMPAARVIVCLGFTVLAAGFGLFKLLEGLAP